MKLDKSSYESFVECKNKTSQSSLGRETKSNSKEGLLDKDDFISSVSKAIDECLTLVPLAKEEVKDKSYLVNAIEASNKRLSTQKSLYEFLNKSSESEAVIIQDPNSAEVVNESQALSRINFAMTTISAHEQTEWERAARLDNSATSFNPWSFVIIFVMIVVGLRFFSLRKPNK